jgi:ribose 5-phosphate isomerase B
MNIAVGSDHCGFEMKSKMLPYLNESNEVSDFGCYSTEMVDFPDISKKVCAAILNGEAERGIMFCSTGIGAAIACNKIKGIRAGVCHDIYSAHQCVEHDNVQVLVLGGEIIGHHVAKELIDTFLSAEFSEDEEFRKRVKMLEIMDKE